MSRDPVRVNGSGSVVAVDIPSTTPAAKRRSGNHFDFILHNDNVLHRNCTTHGYSRRRTRSILLTVRVGGGWSGIYREG